MIGQMTEKKISEFSLGAGVMYICRGNVPEAEMERYSRKAGDTEKGLSLTYEYKTRELYDVEGNSAGILRYGERLTVKGKLCRIIADSFKAMMSKDAVYGGTSELTVLLVCPLPEDESFRLYLRGAVPTGMTFAVADGGGLDFELVCGKGVKHPVFCLKDESATGGDAA